MSIYNIVEGTTGTLQFQLLENGVAISLSGLTVSLLLEDRTGTAVSSPGTVTVIDSASGKVQLAPTGTSVFVAANGPYYARWKLVNGAGSISYVPSANRDIWNIVGL